MEETLDAYKCAKTSIKYYGPKSQVLEVALE